MDPFVLTSEYIELYKLLKAVGICPSGGAAKEAVSQGLVLVDGRKETRKGCKIRAGQVVNVGSARIEVIKE